MANRHFGNIGDIWKHLPLAEILAVEGPAHYWESHAGSADYPLTHSAARDYGVFQFMEHARQSPAIDRSRFHGLLNTVARGASPVYPGSPRIAMTILGSTRVSYLFCDIDAESLATIDALGALLNIPSGGMRCVKADGVSTLGDEVVRLAEPDVPRTFVLIDPCAGDEPFLRRDGRPSPMDLFAVLTGSGIKAMLWYGFDSNSQRALSHLKIREALASHAIDARDPRLWCGEIGLLAIDEPGFMVDPGVKGCGILCGCLRDETQAVCSTLGEELARIYTAARLPGGESGEIEFRVVGPGLGR